MSVLFAFEIAAFTSIVYLKLIKKIKLSNTSIVLLLFIISFAIKFFVVENMASKHFEEHENGTEQDRVMQARVLLVGAPIVIGIQVGISYFIASFATKYFINSNQPSDKP